MLDVELSRWSPLVHVCILVKELDVLEGCCVRTGLASFCHLNQDPRDFILRFKDDKLPLERCTRRLRVEGYAQRLLAALETLFVPILSEFYLGGQLPHEFIRFLGC